MLASEAKKIILDKITFLSNLDERWSNCNKCDKNGKCCDGAPISLFPEEWDELRNYLLNNESILKYSIKRYSENRICYFYNPNASKCLIYDYRPLNCIWTPFFFFYGSKKLTGFIKDTNCNFIKVNDNRNYEIIDTENGIIQLDLSLEEKNNGFMQYYLLLQSLASIQPLLRRNSEFRSIKLYYDRFKGL